MKTAELTGAELDYWVAKAEGKVAKIEDGECLYYAVEGDEFIGWPPFVPSTDWHQGGQIIEREEGAFKRERTENGDPIYFARMGQYGQKRVEKDGPTHLIAAMRAYVASKFGDEVQD